MAEDGIDDVVMAAATLFPAKLSLKPLLSTIRISDISNSIIYITI